MLADSGRSAAPDFKIGNQVFVKAQFFHTTCPSKKLSKKYLGPYEIIAQASSHSFTLQLPDFIHAIHPVFHVSMLKPSIPNTIPNWTPPPPPPIEVKGKTEYKIEQILDSKVGSPDVILVRSCTRWLGLVIRGTDEEFSWLTATELEHAQELVSNFSRCLPRQAWSAVVLIALTLRFTLGFGAHSFYSQNNKTNIKKI